MDYYIVSDDRWFLLGLSTISARVFRHVSLVYPEPGTEYISPVRGDVIIINIRNAELRAALLQRRVLAFCRVIILTHPNIITIGNVAQAFPWILPDNITPAELSEYLLLAGKTPVEHKGITGRDRKVQKSVVSFCNEPSTFRSERYSGIKNKICLRTENQHYKKLRSEGMPHLRAFTHHGFDRDKIIRG